LADCFGSLQSLPSSEGGQGSEALHYFSVHNITWRALPARFGPWNSVWKRFSRLSKAGVFEDYFALLADLSGTAHLVQMFDSTIVRGAEAVIFDRLFDVLKGEADFEYVLIDGTIVSVHQKASGAKGGLKLRPSAVRKAA